MDKLVTPDSLTYSDIRSDAELSEVNTRSLGISASTPDVFHQLTDTINQITSSFDLQALSNLACKAGRTFLGAQGCTLILRDKGQCLYLNEDAIAPLWKGMHFSLNYSVAGWVILHNQSAFISDITLDPRVPFELYRSTFVKSLSMIPIGRSGSIGAIGCYWAEQHHVSTEEIVLQQALADAIAQGLENLGLYQEVASAHYDAEQYLRAAAQSEQRFRATFEQAAVGIVLLSPEGQWQLVNQKFCAITGYSHSEILALTTKQLLFPEDLPITLEQMRRLLDNEIQSDSREKRYLKKNGDSIWVNTTTTLIRNADSSPDYFLLIIKDIQTEKLIELAYQKNTATLRVSQHLAKLGNWEWNVITNEHMWSYEIYLIFGYDPTLPPVPYPQTKQFYTEDSWASITAATEQALQHGTSYECNAQIIHSDGTSRWVTVRGGATVNTMSAVVYMNGTIQDITERKNAEDQLRKLSMAVEQSPESIVITDIRGNIEYVNETFIRNTGFSLTDLIGKNPRILHSNNTPKSTYADLWEKMLKGETWQGEFFNRRKDGTDYIEHAVISPIRQPNGVITHYLAIKEDITQKKQTEEKLHQLAFYDALTGMPNRTLLLAQLENAIEKAQRHNHRSALLLFNIDRFKTYNDAGGQLLGDALLKAVAQRLSTTLRYGDIIARVTGDEFAIVLMDLAPHQHPAAHLALQISEQLHRALTAPLELANDHVTLTAGMGISLFPENSKDTAIDVLRRANTALHHAKSRGTGQTAFFENGLDQMAKHRFSVESELHQGIAMDELRVFLQSQVDADGTIVGAEALVRWQHPKHGLLPPNSFIPIAEESNLIVELGTWVFNKVCQLLANPALADFPIRIAVNISPRHFRRTDFVAQIQQGIRLSGINPNQLTLEVTEGMLINNINDVIGKMTELHSMGIHFSLDDFGTGYSSLSYLKQLPIQELKIDKSFVQDITTDPNNAMLVETILAVAKHMHLDIVAEGVETAEQAYFLNQRGKVTMQGYFYSKPEPAEGWVQKLTAH